MRALFVVLLVAALGGAARAQAPPPATSAPTWVAPPPASEEPAPRRAWYGWQILLLDLAVLPFVAGGIGKLGEAQEWDTATVALVAFAPYALSSPLVHAANGHRTRALAFGLIRGAIIYSVYEVDDLEVVPGLLLLGVATYVYELTWNCHTMARAKRASDGSWTFAASPTADGAGAMAGVVGSF